MITNKEKNLAEGTFVSLRLSELKSKIYDGDFNLKRLQEINQYLFQDLPKLGKEYAEFYKPGIFRQEVAKGVIWTKSRKMPGIKYTSNIVYSNMDKQIINETEKYLKDNIDINKMKRMQTKTFVKKMTEIYSKLDYLHPFRDGNSRTIREFTRELASRAGFEMNWEKSNLNQERRNELYIARDIAVNQIAHEKMQIPEGKYDIEMYMKSFKNCKKLEEILSENIEKIKVKKQKIVMSFSDKDKSNNRNMGR